MSLELKVDIKGLNHRQRALARIKGQVPYIMTETINRAGFAARRSVIKEMGRVFDRPTRWILKSPFFYKATKHKMVGKLTLEEGRSKQGVTGWDILQPHIQGGIRKPKRSELALRRAGVLPDDMLTVPGRGARIDRYGNMASGQIVKILSYFRAYSEVGYVANISAKRKAKLRERYFAVKKPKGNLQPGIYQVKRGRVVPLLIFVKQAMYRKRFDFVGVGTRAAQKKIKVALPEIADYAIRTAR